MTQLPQERAEAQKERVEAQNARVKAQNARAEAQNERAGDHDEPAREHNARARAHRAREEAERRETLATLRGLSERDTFATSALARAAQRASDHFAAADAAGEDRIELWGRRIGRALSLAGFVALAIYLYVTRFAK